MFKSIKRFTILKAVNRFSKIKETFTVKLKMIFVDYHFQLHQTPKNTKNILHRNKQNIRLNGTAKALNGTAKAAAMIPQAMLAKCWYFWNIIFWPPRILLYCTPQLLFLFNIH
jgi:replicative DNA helicase